MTSCYCIIQSCPDCVRLPGHGHDTLLLLFFWSLSQTSFFFYTSIFIFHHLYIPFLCFLVTFVYHLLPSPSPRSFFSFHRKRLCHSDGFTRDGASVTPHVFQMAEFPIVLKFVGKLIQGHPVKMLEAPTGCIPAWGNKDWEERLDLCIREVTITFYG